MDTLTEFIQTYYSLDMLVALIVAIVGIIVAVYVRQLLLRILAARQMDRTASRFLVNAIYTLILVLITIAVLAKLGIPTASLLTILGASSLAIGLALKDSLANVAAGLLILFNKPFRKGDFVVINGVEGTVDVINLFTTRLRSSTNEVIYLPNAKLVSDKIINKTYYHSRRLDLKLGISYSANIEHVRTILMDVIHADKRVLSKPAPLVAITDFADSAVLLTVRVWVNKADYVAVQFDLLEAIKQTFDNNNIVIPFPQREVHIKKDVLV